MAALADQSPRKQIGANMKKYLAAIFVTAILIFCLSSCGESDYARDQEAKREAIYESGYEAGFKDGYSEAMQKAPGRIESRVDDDIWDLCCEIENKYGIHPEEAAMILSIYADVPDEVTEEELNKAIWAMYRYYFESCKIMNEIEEYWID